jgi:hypothetical protein
MQEEAEEDGHVFREAALDIVFASCAFWEKLDGFKSLLMRGVSKRVRDEVMDPLYIREVLLHRYMLDLDNYLLMRQKETTTMLGRRPPVCPWHYSDSMLMIDWKAFTCSTIPWDWSAPRKVRTRREAGIYLDIFKHMALLRVKHTQATELLRVMRHGVCRADTDYANTMAIALKKPRRVRTNVFVGGIIAALEKDMAALVMDNEVAASIITNSAMWFD